MKTRVFAVCTVVFLFCGIVHAGLNDGLVAYYPFNGNVNDESGNGNNGTINGAKLTADRFGNVDSAYSFVARGDSMYGTGDYIEINNSSSLNLGKNDFTFVAWIKTTRKGGAKILSKGQSNCLTGYAFQTDSLASGGDADYFTAWSVSSGRCLPRSVSKGIVNDGKWHLLVGVVKRSNSQMYYIDGELDTIDYNSPPADDISNNNNLRIGLCDRYGNRPFDGMIDDIRIYNRALSASEVQQLYQGQDTCSKEVVKFISGTPAKAADVNANFDALNCQIQALKAIVCKNEPTASVCQ